MIIQYLHLPKLENRPQVLAQLSCLHHSTYSTVNKMCDLYDKLNIDIMYIGYLLKLLKT